MALRGGRNQQAVFKALEAAHKPLTAYQLLDQLRDEGITAPLTIYRALDRLQKDGLIHRIESLNAWLCCCQSGSCGHHSLPVFAICEACGNAVELIDEDVRSALQASLARVGFSPKTITIEVKGECSFCKRKEGADSREVRRYDDGSGAGAAG